MGRDIAVLRVSPDGCRHEPTVGIGPGRGPVAAAAVERREEAEDAWAEAALGLHQRAHGALEVRRQGEILR